MTFNPTGALNSHEHCGHRCCKPATSRSPKLISSQLCHHPELKTYGCSAHWLNLPGRDITPLAVIEHITDISMFFYYNYNAPAAWLDECNGSIKPEVPGELTRSLSFNTIDSYLHNRVPCVQILQVYKDDTDKTIVQKI